MSTDGATFTHAAGGTWPADGKIHSVAFGPVQARYVRLTALAVNSGTSAEATELEVGGPGTLTLSTPTVTNWGH